MIQIHQLTYNPFAENTYLLENDENEVLVIDPGMYMPQENARFSEYLQHRKLTPIRLLLTHAHLDHVFGLNWMKEQYDLVPELHIKEKPIYESAMQVAKQYGLSMKNLPKPEYSLKEGSLIEFGEAEIRLALTPGHSPGSISFICEKQKFVIGGDVLFQGSIGRTDLPGGDHDTLIQSIKSILLKLDDDVLVYSGHGPMTTIGQERVSNPFLTMD